MTASFHSRTCSLPRTQPRTGSPAHSNKVAVVSPMPTAKHPKQVKRSASDSCSEMAVASAPKNQNPKEEPQKTQSGETPKSKGEGEKSGDPLKAIVPMQPLFNGSNSLHSQQEVTVNNAQISVRQPSGKTAFGFTSIGFSYFEKRLKRSSKVELILEVCRILILIILWKRKNGSHPLSHAN